MPSAARCRVALLVGLACVLICAGAPWTSALTAQPARSGAGLGVSAAIGWRAFTVAGFASGARAVEGIPATSVDLSPTDVAALPTGGFVIADAAWSVVWLVTPDGILRRLAGVPGRRGFTGDGGPARAARLEGPAGVAVAADGAVLVADTDNHRIRRIAPDGVITTVAGSGATGEFRGGFGGDGGPATAARLDRPTDLVVTLDGGILVVDDGNSRVRRISADARIETVAGGGAEQSGGPEASATKAALDGPSAVAALPDGGFLVGETFGLRIRHVTADGRISTFAGRGAPPAPRAPHSAGDGGPARKASFESVGGLALTAEGEVLLSDGQRVRRIGRDGTITAFAGSGRWPGDPRSVPGDGGAATAADMSPGNLAITDQGAVLVSDTSALRYLAPPGVDWLAGALRADQARATQHRYRIGWQTTRPARVLIEIFSERRRIAAVRAPQGARSVMVSRGFRPGSYWVRMTARDARGAVATHHATVVLGGSIRLNLARDLVNEFGPGESDYYTAAGRCHRFSRRRVDCEGFTVVVGAERDAGGCSQVLAVRLLQSGQLRGRQYSCPGFRRRAGARRGFRMPVPTLGRVK